MTTKLPFVATQEDVMSESTQESEGLCTITQAYTPTHTLHGTSTFDKTNIVNIH